MNSTSNPSEHDISITRTYRMAMKLGEDYITLEETITMPVNATDADIEQAVQLGWRIYQAQNAALEQQTTALREAWRARFLPASRRKTDGPASTKQHNYLAILQHSLNWSDEELHSYAQEQSIHLPDMTRAQAASLIDSLMKLAEERVLTPFQTDRDAQNEGADTQTPRADHTQRDDA